MGTDEAWRNDPRRASGRRRLEQPILAQARRHGPMAPHAWGDQASPVGAFWLASAALGAGELSSLPTRARCRWP
jgi:hypothetical protein